MSSSKRCCNENFSSLLASTQTAKPMRDVFGHQKTKRYDSNCYCVAVLVQTQVRCSVPPLGHDQQSLERLEITDAPIEVLIAEDRSCSPSPSPSLPFTFVLPCLLSFVHSEAIWWLCLPTTCCTSLMYRIAAFHMLNTCGLPTSHTDTSSEPPVTWANNSC